MKRHRRHKYADARGPALAGPRWWPTWIGLAMLRASALLPLRVSRALGRALGCIVCAVAAKRRRITRINLRLCFPELEQRERERLVWAHFAALGSSVFEMAYGWWGPVQSLERLSRITGREYLDEALKYGRGVILLQGHFLTTDIAGQMLGLRIPFTATYAPPWNPVMRRLTERVRSRFVRRQIHHGEVRRIVKCLAENEIVWHGPDQSPRRRNAVEARFFGQRTLSNTATAKLARISSAPVVPYHPVRRSDGHYELRIQPMLREFPSNDVVADAQRINDILEEHIRMAPEQYLWAHKRFKRTRPGVPDPYA